jgi:Putative Ig domain
MRFRIPATGIFGGCVFTLLTSANVVQAATLSVPAGGNLQAALNAAQPGDVILLQPGAVYLGNFTLPNKGPITDYITLRSAAPDDSLPPAGKRITPAYAPLLPKLKSPTTTSALRAAAGANHWKLMFLEFQANLHGNGEIIAFGVNDSTQTQLSQVPYALVLDRVYVHGDPLVGQKRGIALNSRDTAVINSHVSECKAVGQDSQAIGGFNGPGNYLIENNYLEGAGENVLLGGSDPQIPNLVTSNVTVRRNYMRKPIEWRDPIVASPAGASAAAAPGAGSLGPGTYSYKVVARGAAGKATSAPTAEVSATLPAGTQGGVTISWTPVAGAEEYLVYGRTGDSQNIYWKTSATYFSDSGAAGTSGIPAAAGTRWSVKNTFELKNAEDVLIEGNVFEKLWVADQPGFPIVFTPRNQGGKAPWVVVQRVVFRHNIVRHAAGGVNILGTDNVAPSRRTNNITIYNNLFDDLTASIWGSSKVFQLGVGPDAVTIDHNTVITTNSTIVWFYGGVAASPTPITNSRITNNMSAHNSYGITGTNFSPGTAIAAYMPDGTVSGNVLAGGLASKYPPGNFFPTVSAWESGFANYAARDYHLVPGSPYKGAATDGSDTGADIDRLTVETAVALTGDNTISPDGHPVRIVTTTLPNGRLNEPYAQLVSCAGGSGDFNWLIRDSRLPAGVAFDSVAGLIVGTPATVETGSITLEVYDRNDPTRSATETLTLTIDPPPFVINMPVPPAGRVGIAYQLTPSVSGSLGTVTWTQAAGALPSGVTLDAFTGRLGGVPAAWGTTTAVIEARDSWRPDRTDSRPVTITIAPEPLSIATTTLIGGVYNTMYRADLQATGGTGAVTWSLVSGALPTGLALSASGAIMGTPTVIGTFAFTVKAVDSKWSETATGNVTLVIAPPPFTVTVPAVTSGRVGLLYSAVATASGQLGNVVWSLAPGSLPPGVSVNSVSGVIAGTPSTFGTFSPIIQARDSWSGSRVASAAMIISIAPSQLSITTRQLANGRYGSAYLATLRASGGTGQTTWRVTGGAPPPGLSVASSGVISGEPMAAGTFRFGVTATDAGWTGNVARRDFAIVVGAREIVLYAADAGTIAGTWARVADATAAGGVRLANPNNGVPKLTAPLAAPANYFDVPFAAEAGVAYRLWIRGKAVSNSWANDSMMVQFSNSVDASGIAKYRIGTTSAHVVTLEDCSGCGLSGWGWQDNGFGLDVLGPVIYFERTGPQTVRVQVREDGFSIDQIVLSAVKYLTVSPGALKNDTTILAR